MTNPTESFELELKKQSSKLTKTLYDNKKQQNKNTFKPQDVISSVSLQMKAIQVADSLKSQKVTKKLNPLRKSTFLNVNNLPAYNEVPKQQIKFDTQFATDTQLINIIEDAEMIDAHAGMTEEFESSFCQTEMEDQTVMKERDEPIDDESNIKRDKDEENGILKASNVKDGISKNDDVNAQTVVLKDNNRSENVTSNEMLKDAIISGSKIADGIRAMDVEDIVTIRNKRKLDIDDDDLIGIFDNNNKDLDTQFDEYTQILDKCIEIEDEDIERPLSPIFMQKSKPKSKPTTPLIFDLDKFERFEQIAMPIVESNDLKTAKHVINSQILDNELLIKVNEVLPPDKGTKLTNKDAAIVNSLKFQIDEHTGTEIPLIVEDPDLEIQFLELDKEITEDLIKKVKEENTEILKDEILFSSDEEEFVKTSYQDLPFTCALETSFYNDKDLNETMFVGFQTASNKSIQVFTESFAKAKSLLNNISENSDDLTVTDLVNHCDGSVKVKDAKIDFVDKETELGLACYGLKSKEQENIDLSSEEKESGLDCPVERKKIGSSCKEGQSNLACNDDANISEIQEKIVLSYKEKELNLPCENNAYELSVKSKIGLSNKEKHEEQGIIGLSDEGIQINLPCNVAANKLEGQTKIALRDKRTQLNSVSNDNSVVVQNIDDDVLIVSAVNVREEISVNHFQGFKTASNKNIQLSEKALARCNKVFQDIDVNEDFSSQTEDLQDNKEDNHITNEENKENESVILNVPKTEVDKGLTDDVQNIDDVIQEFDVEMSLEEDRDIKKETENMACIKIEMDSIDGLEGAAIETYQDYVIDIDFDNDFTQVVNENNFNKNIKEENPENIENINEITKIDKPIEISDTLDDIIDNINQPSTSTAFIGFKTANNKNINISKQALAKTKNIFKDIDSTELQIPEINLHPKKDGPENIANINSEKENDIFEGFKTASNKNIAISKESLAKTANIFKDLDSDDFKFPEKVNKEVIKETESIRDLEQPSTSKTFIGFKTANNKEITISDAALAKTIDIFKDINKDYKGKDSNIIDEEKIEIDNVFNESFNVIPEFVGFKTANNKNIKISELALAKTKNLFNDIDSDNFKFPSKSNDKSQKTHKELNENMYGQKENFKTPYPVEEINKNFEENSLKKLDFNQSFTEKARFVGFKTANNKNINITDGSIARTKNIFKDIEENSDLFEKDDILKEIDNKPTNTSFVGFKTGNNKLIKISETALAKTKNIFKDLDQIEAKKIQKDDYPIITEDISETEININKNEIKSMENTKKTLSIRKFQGFTTASNKKVKISEEALIKSKNIFKDIDNIELKIKDNDTTINKEIENKGKDNPNKFHGFTTASNKKVNISEEALIKSKNIFKDIDNTELKMKEKDNYPNINKDIDNKGKDNPNTFLGFTTASNKKVKVSEEALLKTRNIFKDVDNIELKIKEKDNYPIINKDIENKRKDNPNTFLGFTTASNKKVKVSEEALIKTKNIFKDINEDEEMNKNPFDDNNGKSGPIFKGFKTANKKTVSISKEAIDASKDIFNNIKETEFLGFKTASNNKVEISEKALKESRKIFVADIIFEPNDKNIMNGPETGIKFRDFEIQETVDKLVDKKASKLDLKEDTGIKRNKRKYTDIDSEINKKDNIINDILDTQVQNQFEESLHTEDFNIKTPIKSKRSGSPILSCPKAKKRRKFETPYSQKIPQKVEKNEKIDTNTNNITFTDNYKSNKCYTLKDLQKITQESTNNKIDPYLTKFDFNSLLLFEFLGQRNNLTDTPLSINKLKDLFTGSINRKLIPDGWLNNHIKLILWKLVSYEIKFDLRFNAQMVLDQLKYRYDRELYNAQRPVLRKILEKDDVPSKTMVLCVAGVFENGISVASASTTNLELLLTDGWYTIMCTPDKMLARVVCAGKVAVGTKLAMCGAELVNCEQGVSPWEDTSAVRLKIFGNSTRRARWDARLGCHGNGAILSQLSAVRVDGGKVAKLRVLVTRVYPAMYVEKFEDGSTVTRSERLEHVHQMKIEAERQSVMEKLYEEVEKEFADQESQDSEGFTDSCNRTCLESGSQIAKLMKNSRDPVEFRAHLTSSQARLLETHTSKRREHLLEDIQKRIRQKVEKAGVVDRNVVVLLKIRVAGVEDKEGGVVTKGMMSIWKPTDAVQEIIKEGAWIDVMNVVPTAVRYSEIQISAGRSSIFSASKYKEPENFKPYTTLLKRKCFTIKDLAQNPAMPTDYNEIDTVGFIFQIDPSISDFESTKQPFQNVYLADFDKNIVCINFWGGLKKFGFHNVLDTGQIVSCVNLQKRAGNTRKSIPQYRVTEFSYFTKTPKNGNARIIIDDLNKKFLSLDRRKFCEQCIEFKNKYSVKNNENVSPYRFNNSDYNRSSNKIFIDSPLARPKKDDNFNLTGLDFESTFRQTDTQNLPEEVLIRKRKVNEKIAKLKMYGEPPPLTNLHIINKSKSASNSYKSPLLTNQSSNKNELSNSKSDSYINVASNKKSPDNTGGDSPGVLNKTYVKSIGPVKIDFDMKDDSKVDHFAEDFDGSPPLSLD
ncbi:unnamed protein product [Chrysodeixis includens]|uniref:Uncharacterized protein n=1 Tax=Chrysodeixis includens TaxID=689277 RepID=A0A9P0BXB8_CHRIL|nr:unnamed protein product [Chrysodeixis includens]